MRRPYSRLIGGLLEVYDDFPWVSKDEEGNEYGPIESTNPYWDEDEDGNCKEQWRYGLYEMSYINPSEIASAHDCSFQDIQGTIYTCCQILTKDGEEYWITELWPPDAISYLNEEEKEEEN